MFDTQNLGFRIGISIIFMLKIKKAFSLVFLYKFSFGYSDSILSTYNKAILQYSQHEYALERQPPKFEVSKAFNCSVAWIFSPRYKEHIPHIQQHIHLQIYSD
jgi:hypothetical protein